MYKTLTVIENRIMNYYVNIQYKTASDTHTQAHYKTDAFSFHSTYVFCSGRRGMNHPRCAPELGGRMLGNVTYSVD